MEETCALLERAEARAEWLPGLLVITARGDFPESCWEARVERNWLQIWPPEFVLTRCRTASVCLEVITPYAIVRAFPSGERPDSVVLHDADGARTVPVEDATALATGGAALDESEEGSYDEATGLSASMSFDEAFANALQGLPSWSPPFPDAMATVAVTQVGAWFGGIAGFHHLFVRVRRPRA